MLRVLSGWLSSTTTTTITSTNTHWRRGGSTFDADGGSGDKPISLFRIHLHQPKQKQHDSHFTMLEIVGDEQAPPPSVCSAATSRSDTIISVDDQFEHRGILPQGSTEPGGADDDLAEVTMVPPKCWCRLPTSAKLARMAETHPLHPGRAFWTCPNIGCLCSFFRWASETSNKCKDMEGEDEDGSPRKGKKKITNERNKDLVGFALPSLSCSSHKTPKVPPISPISKPFRSSAPIPIPGGSSRRRVGSSDLIQETTSSMMSHSRLPSQ
jgi:hypothetical protein